MNPLDKQKQGLNELIEAHTEKDKTILAYLKDDAGQSSPKAFMDVIDRLEIIRSLNLNLDIHDIHPNRIRQAVDYLRASEGINEDLLTHIAPLGWEHISFLGEYAFDIRDTSKSEELRPLNTER